VIAFATSAIDARTIVDEHNANDPIQSYDDWLAYRPERTL